MLMTMSSQSIIRTFRLLYHIQNFTINRNTSIFRYQKSSLFPRQSLFFLPSLHFRTSVRLNDDEDNIYDPNLYIYDPVKKIKCVIHEDNPEMPEVTLTVTQPDGKNTVPVKARVGNTVMRAILKYNEENEEKILMEAACNGSKACTTCHVYCDEGVSEYFTPPDTDEDDLVDSAPFLKENSRLCCQMRILKPFDNINFKLPKATVNFAVDKKTKTI